MPVPASLEEEKEENTNEVIAMQTNVIMNQHEVEEAEFEQSLPNREIDFLAQPVQSLPSQQNVSPFKAKNPDAGLSGFKNMSILSNKKDTGKSQYQLNKEQRRKDAKRDGKK